MSRSSTTSSERRSIRSGHRGRRSSWTTADRRLVGRAHPAPRCARERPRRPVPPQLRQGGGAPGRVPGGPGRRRLHARRRPPGRPGRDPPLPRDSSTRASTSSAAGRRPGTTPGTRSVPAASSTGWSAGLTGCRLHDHNCGFKALPPRGARARSASTASCTGSSRSWRTPAASASARSWSTTGRASSAVASTASRGSSRGSSTC